MKKILSTVAALAVTFSAQGETTSAINPFAGWYIGLGAAVSNSSDKVESLYGQGYDDIYGFIPANAAVSPQNVVIEPEANGAVINAHTAAQPDQDVPVYAYLLNAAAATVGQAQVALPNLVKNNFYYLSSQADPAAIAANSIWVQDGVLQAAANAQNAADATQYRYVDIEGFSAKTAWTKELHKPHTNVGGTVAIGYMFNIKNKASIGIEVGADFMAGGSAHANNTNPMTGQVYSLTAKRNPVRPMASLIIGMPVDESLMPYLKVGMSRHKSKKIYEAYVKEWEHDDTGYYMVNKGLQETATYSKASTRPLVALGVETKVSPNMSVRYELEYRWGKKFTKTFSATTLNEIALNKTSGAEKNRLHQKSSLTFRLLCMFRPSSRLFSTK